MGQPSLPSQESRAPAHLSFGGSPVHLPTSFNAERQIQHGNPYEEGRALGIKSATRLRLPKCVARFISGS